MPRKPRFLENEAVQCGTNVVKGASSWFWHVFFGNAALQRVHVPFFRWHFFSRFSLHYCPEKRRDGERELCSRTGTIVAATATATAAIALYSF